MGSCYFLHKKLHLILKYCIYYSIQHYSLRYNKTIMLISETDKAAVLLNCIIDIEACNEIKYAIVDSVIDGTPTKQVQAELSAIWEDETISHSIIKEQYDLQEIFSFSIQQQKSFLTDLLIIKLQSDGQPGFKSFLQQLGPKTIKEYLQWIEETYLECYCNPITDVIPSPESLAVMNFKNKFDEPLPEWWGNPN